MKRREKTGFKASRRAFVASCLSVAVCGALLIGATFALFTDEETANVQLITVGSLDVCLVDADGKEITSSDTLEFTGWENETSAVIYDDDTLTLENFYVKNKSDVAVTYTIAVTDVTGKAKDAVASYSVTVGETDYRLADETTGEDADSINLAAADEETDYTMGNAIVFKVTADEDVSNYMGDEVGSYVITVTVTQADESNESE